MSEKLIIVSAPSGAGKTTLVKHLLASFLNLKFSISCTTRAARGTEKDGEDYYFISEESFKQKIKNEEFAEYEEVYEGCFYGTLISEIQRIWSKQKHVIFDIDVKGGLNLKKQFPQKSLAIFVMPPSVETLETRLRSRNTEDEAFLIKRVNKAVHELSYAEQFDVIVRNDDLDVAKQEITGLVKTFI